MNNHNHYYLYSTSIYDYITSNGRISKKLFEKIVIPQLDSAFKVQQDNNKLIKEIDSLKKQLDEALKVIEFYGDESIWEFSDSGLPFTYRDVTECGFVAREFLQKMKEMK